jgi:hypothetical protein
MKAVCSGGTAAVAALLWLASAHGAARADFVSYTFTGKDGSTGGLVTGSFSYDTSAPHAPAPPSALLHDAEYPDVRGSLSLTDNGHTYTNTSVAAGLQPNVLILYGSPPGFRGGIYLILPWSEPGLSSITSLPPAIDMNQLANPFFAVTGGLTVPNIAGGPITSVVLQSSPSTAPEPGALTLAAIATAGALAAARRNRRGAAQRRSD